jgi:hypothetical protein
MIWSGSTELNRHRGIMIMSWWYGIGVFRGRDARGGKASDKK